MKALGGYALYDEAFAGASSRWRTSSASATRRRRRRERRRPRRSGRRSSTQVSAGAEDSEAPPSADDDDDDGVCVGGRRHCFCSTTTPRVTGNPSSYEIQQRVRSSWPLRASSSGAAARRTMTVKRRSHGRNKKGRGHVNRVRCVSTGKAIPKDKAIKRFIVRNIVEASALRDIKDASCIEGYQLPKIYIKQFYSVEAAIHQRVVRVRSVGARARPPSTRPAAVAAAPSRRGAAVIQSLRSTPAAPLLPHGTLAPPPRSTQPRRFPRAQGSQRQPSRALTVPPHPGAAREFYSTGASGAAPRVGGPQGGKPLDVGDVVEARPRRRSSAWCHAVIACAKIGASANAVP